MPTTITDIMNDDYTTELTIDVDGLERRATIYKISAWQAGTPVIANSFNYCYEVLLHYQVCRCWRLVGSHGSRSR